jgi:anti-sigma factor RsiW
MNAPDQNLPMAHEQASSLIWYVTGTLSDSERRDVERHLESCAECRAELESLRELRGDVRAAYDAEPAPSPRLKLALLERIKSAPTKSIPQTGRSSPRELARDRGAAPRRLSGWTRPLRVPRWVSATALVLIVVQAGFLIRPNLVRPPTGGEVTTRGLAPSTTRLRAVFDPQASALQIRELLSSLGARIVDGPSSDGAYVIELLPGDPKSLGAKLKAARASSVLQSIDLAQP